MSRRQTLVVRDTLTPAEQQARFTKMREVREAEIVREIDADVDRAFSRLLEGELVPVRPWNPVPERRMPADDAREQASAGAEDETRCASVVSGDCIIGTGSRAGTRPLSAPFLTSEDW